VLLRDSKYENDVDYITNVFDKTTKLRFRSQDDPQFIKFGTARDKDLTLGIRSGQLKLAGYVLPPLSQHMLMRPISTDVATFFEPSITCIAQAILAQQEAAKIPISVSLLSYC
jgi:hypothetical protein